ncbi:PREDICTED: uncharacterized protein LOC104773462 [Camelina sativa]|uniref:Uncharacterized protein LOC104773462 n=1 Tax=Camelina sativa TaxID=90675 RepID=A0ABM1RGS3_CAMSA|nr:PREDICTED: uncharacterized protein LOC104773462 [Camelina sativa]
MANAKSFLTLDQLDRKRFYRHSITVRLLRKWEFKNFKKDNELLGMNLLFLDQKENTIQGTVHQSLLQKFVNQLSEGSIIEIYDFNVQDCNKNYKVSDHKFQIRLTERTRVTIVGQESCQIPREKFRFRNDEGFVKLQDHTIDLYDAIGYIKHMDKTDVRTTTTPTLRKVTLTLLLEDGNEIPATLWAEQAELLEDKYRGVENNNIVLIMTSVLVKIYQSEIYLSASSGTKFYLNHDSDPVDAFRKSLRYNGECLVNLGDITKQNKRPEDQQSINDIWEYVSSDDRKVKIFFLNTL